MKTRKILAYFLGAALLVGSASCSDDLEYTPAQLPDNAQVYFPNTNPTEIDLAGAESSFDVTITRRKSDEALTVALELQGGEGNYSAPRLRDLRRGRGHHGGEHLLRRCGHWPR